MWTATRVAHQIAVVEVPRAGAAIRRSFRLGWIVLLVSCTGTSEPLLDGELREQVLIDGRFALYSDPSTRSLPLLASIDFRSDGTMVTEKTGLGATWSLPDPSTLRIGERDFRWNPRRHCLFSPEAPGSVLGWCILGRDGAAERWPELEIR